MRAITIRTTIALAALLLAAFGTTARAIPQQPLPLGRIVEGTTGSTGPAVFSFNAETPGVLTVVVRGRDDADLQISVTDAVGQTLPDGRIDVDLGGDVGAEQGAVVIRAPGDYQVQVGTWGGGGRFEIAASWLEFASLGGPADPDGLPISSPARRSTIPSRRPPATPGTGSK